MGVTLDDFETLWAHFGVTFGCVRVALVPLSPIFRKQSFSLLHICWHTLVLLGGHFGVTLEHFGRTLVQLWGDFGHIAFEWQV